MDEFIQADMFTSLTFCVAFVMLATQVLKKYLTNVDTQLIAFMVSIIVVIVRIFIVNDLSPMGTAMGILNIIPILASSIGVHQIGSNMASKMKGEK